VVAATIPAPSHDVDVGHDEALALEATRDGGKAFRMLYARHRRQVLASVTKLIGAGPDREDVVQEVFLQLHRALPTFRGDSRLSTFLRRIVVNVALDHVRKRCRRQRFAGDSGVLEAVVDGRQDLERHLSARQQLQRLFHQLDGIAQDKRRALMLVAVAGLSLNDAAVKMGADVTWVKQRVARARRELTRPLRDTDRRR
jgi:RNA polymerase sigma-70 factor (ECF subfamily)